MPFPRPPTIIGYVSDTRSRRLVAAASTGIAFGAVNFISDRFIILPRASPELHSWVEATSMGVLAGALLLLFLLGTHSRREMLASELARVAELNHTLRNSLEVIIHSHYLEHEPHSELMIQTAEAMNMKLRQLFPMVGAERRYHSRR